MNTDLIIIIVVAVIALYVAWSHGKLTGINKTLTGAQAPAVTAALKSGASTVADDFKKAIAAAHSALQSAAPTATVAAAPVVLVTTSTAAPLTLEQRVAALENKSA